MLRDLDKDTVDFVPNYDGERIEPRVLPAAIPNLLANGSSGIAVGMATNIPPHNMREIVDGLLALLDSEELEIDELLKFVKAPDFPTGGIIYGMDGVRKAYLTGKGLVKIRAVADIEHDEKKNKNRIIVSEIPYQVNKSNLIEKIADLVKAKKLDGITDVRDESDRDGMRIVIELRRGEVGEVILNQLFLHTQMQITFGIIMIALVNYRPRLLNLKQIMIEFLNHRRDVLVRRTKYILKKAEQRAHILEGLRIALENIDAIIQLIKAAANQEVARNQLMAAYELTEIQARAILDMRLHRLTGLEQEKIQEEYLELIKKINQYKAILASDQLLKEEIRQELLVIKEKYGDDRRTKIIETAFDLDPEKFVKEEDVVVFVTHTGYTKRNSLDLYRAQKRRGHGVTGIIAKEGDFVEHLFIASTHDYLLIFTNRGKIYWIKVYNIPDMGRTSRGQALVNLVNLDQDESVAAIISVRDFEEGNYIIMATRRGIVKKTRLEAFKNPRSNGIKAIGLDEDDELIGVQLTSGENEVFLATKLGKAIRFSEKDIRPIGRPGRGVIGIRLKKDDVVMGMDVVNEGLSILTLTENGYGKRTMVDEYRVQNRGGQGIINIKANRKTGNVVGVLQIIENDEIFMITIEGKMIHIKIDQGNMRTIGRSTQGVKMQDIPESDTIVATARLAREDNGEDYSSIDDGDPEPDDPEE